VSAFWGNVSAGRRSGETYRRVGVLGKRIGVSAYRRVGVASLRLLPISAGTSAYSIANVGSLDRRQAQGLAHHFEWAH